MGFTRSPPAAHVADHTGRCYIHRNSHHHAPPRTSTCRTHHHPHRPCHLHTLPPLLPHAPHSPPRLPTSATFLPSGQTCQMVSSFCRPWAVPWMNPCGTGGELFPLPPASAATPPHHAHAPRHAPLTPTIYNRASASFLLALYADSPTATTPTQQILPPLLCTFRLYPTPPFVLTPRALHACLHARRAARSPRQPCRHPFPAPHTFSTAAAALPTRCPLLPCHFLLPAAPAAPRLRACTLPRLWLFLPRHYRLLPSIRRAIDIRLPSLSLTCDSSPNARLAALGSRHHSARFANLSLVLNTTRCYARLP